MEKQLAIAAIICDEDPFIDEWIAYHRLLGVDEFILYDDDPNQHLRQLVSKHEAYVTVFDWSEPYNLEPGRDKQTRAYEHALRHTECCWLAFIDGDEFIVIREHESFKKFLAEFADADAILLTWHMFGHNGYYDIPPGLVTQHLVRRQEKPHRMMKSIVRRQSVIKVKSAHVCVVINSMRVFDANHARFKHDNYPGKTSIAHINHYFCRSFTTWMRRVKRGCLSYSIDDYPAGEAWRYEEAACLRKFVEISAVHNEFIDDYMVKYSGSIDNYLNSLKVIASDREDIDKLL